MGVHHKTASMGLPFTTPPAKGLRAALGWLAESADNPRCQKTKNAHKARRRNAGLNPESPIVQADIYARALEADLVILNHGGSAAIPLQLPKGAKRLPRTGRLRAASSRLRRLLQACFDPLTESLRSHGELPTFAKIRCRKEPSRLGLPLPAVSWKVRATRGPVWGRTDRCAQCRAGQMAFRPTAKNA